MVLLKTRPELGKFWENKIYKNQREHQTTQILVYDQSISDDKEGKEIERSDEKENTKTKEQTPTGHNTATI